MTVWSAPNYCYRCGNVASILEFSDVDTRTPKLFEAVPDSNRVIPPRITTPYFLWNYLLHLWSSLMSSNQILGPKDSENIFEIFNLVVKYEVNDVIPKLHPLLLEACNGDRALWYLVTYQIITKHNWSC